MKKSIVLALVPLITLIIAGCSTTGTQTPSLYNFSENKRQSICDDKREKHVAMSQELLEAQRSLDDSEVDQAAHNESKETCWTCPAMTKYYEKMVEKKLNDLVRFEKIYNFCF